MSDSHLYIPVGSQRLHYQRWGHGKHLLLAFHGYGNDAGVFHLFRPYLAEQFTIISFDLPHHGASKWPDDTVLRKKDLLQMVSKMKSDHNVDKVSLLGYSMGGRVCMTIMEEMPDQIEKVVLIATDGLVVNKLYYFCTRTWVGKKLFRNMLVHPRNYFKVVTWLRKTGWLDAARYKFAMQHLQSAESRHFLLQVWPCMSELIPHEAKLKRAIRQYGTPVFIFMGIYDRVMPPSLAEHFSKGLDTVHVSVLERGHRAFDYQNVEQIAKSLL